MAIDVEFLRQVRFLAPLKDRALKRLADSVSVRAAEPGEDIVTQGGKGVAFFVVVEGELAVLLGDRELRKLGPGDHFGEIALVLEDVHRTATVRALTHVRVGTMSKWNFKGFIEEHPETHWPLLVELAQQLANAHRTSAE
jgi:CRP-like cAMP-binding protein